MSSAHEPIQLLEPSNLLEPLDLTERQVVSFACFPRKSRSIGLSETPASPALNGKATGKRLRGPLVRAPCYPIQRPIVAIAPATALRAHRRAGVAIPRKRD